MLREAIDLNALPTHQLEAPEPFEHNFAPTPWLSDCLPEGMAGAATAIAKQVKAPAALAGFAVLHAVGHVAQRIANARRPHDPESGMPCSLFLLSLADSGDRKSECYRLASKPIIDAERKARQGHEQHRQRLEAECAGKPAKEHAGILADLGADPRTIYTEATIEKITQDCCNGSRPALSWSSDEGAQFFGGHSMKGDNATALMGVLTKLYDGSGIERSRISSGSGFRYGVRLSFFLSAQPSVVKSALSDELLRSQGLLARFLLSVPASLKGSRFMSVEDMAPHGHLPEVASYWRTLERMNNSPWQTNEFGDLDLPIAAWSVEATEIWRLQFNQVEAELSPCGELAGISAFAARCGENAARVATVFAVWGMFHTGRADRVVTADDMRRAWELVWYSINEWLRYYQGSALSAVERDAKALLEFLQREPAKWARFTRNELGQRVNSVLRKDAERRRLAIAELVDRRWLVEHGGHLHLVGPVEPEAGILPTAVAVPAVSAVLVDKQAERTANTAETATASCNAQADAEIQCANHHTAKHVDLDADDEVWI
ncbi:DUF3987 domain-containing protein [Crenobacter caeni]|uniref:DUF3987 domain-containing protein n=1 Tax=Crenobacter caeni TaxID=2705474 RepID=A0A6B2KPG2_9NEIS|nr:DUF3987 domain-containing protein [Crenobacter caeni]NDV11707.1 DUF3987 domain-containing protein [Crenobacter caeni]